MIELISNVEMEERGWMPKNRTILLDDIKGIMTIERKSGIPGEEKKPGTKFKIFYPISHYPCASDGQSTGSAICDHLNLNAGTDVKPWWETA